MVVNADLPPEVEEQLSAQAQNEGLTLEQFLARTLQAAVAHPAFGHLGTQSAEEWTRSFSRWVHSHTQNTPLLSDEGFSRESIYGDREL